MIHRPSIVLTALCLLAACGGRAQTTGDDTGSGGASSAGRGGSVASRAGASSGGASSAGASGAGASGAVNCATVNCKPLNCPAGSMPVTQPGECCPSSCSVCACPLILCPEGTHSAPATGVCCPSCVADGDAACQAGRAAYTAQRRTLLTKYQAGCASASECVAVPLTNSCEATCSYDAVWYGVTDSFASNLAAFAGMYCSSCTQAPVPKCGSPPTLGCINGQCSVIPK